jgi:hypothetical protein
MTEFKAPASQQEWDEMKKLLRREISDSDLESVVGGNDDRPTRPDPQPWICPFCGATIMVRNFEDGPKHMTKCPNNPYK